MNPNLIKEIIIKKTILFQFAPKKVVATIILINIILEYSAKKIKANPPLLYSTLNPETNSDSPSAKSNGVRLVSANIEVNNNLNKGNLTKINQQNLW